MRINAVLPAPSFVGGEMEDVGDDVVEWDVLPHPPSGQASFDSVLNALQFDMTRRESDTESVRTVPAEDDHCRKG